MKQNQLLFKVILISNLSLIFPDDHHGQDAEWADLVSFSVFQELSIAMGS